MAVLAIGLVILVGEVSSASHSESHKYTTQPGDHQLAKNMTDTIIVIVDGWIERNKDPIDAISTLFVALFTGTLWFATRGMLNAAREQKLEMAKATEIAGTQVNLSATLADIAAKQKEITRQQFFAEHRPIIIVRNMHMPIGVSDVTLTTRFFYYNRGASAAKITSIAVEVFPLEEQKFIPRNRNPTEYPIDKKELNSNQFGVTEVSIRQPVVCLLNSGKVKIHCIGSIAYGDDRGELGSKYRMGFARIYDPESGRFIPVQDDEYEYSY